MPLTETLTRKVGPLPAWGWGVVVVGGYIVYTVIKGRSGANTLPEGVVTGSPILDTGAGGGGGGGSGGATLQDVIDAIKNIPAAVTPVPGPGTGTGTGAGGSGGGTGTGGSFGGGGSGIIPNVLVNPSQVVAGYDPFPSLPPAVQEAIVKTGGYGAMPANDPVRFYTRDQQLTYMAQIAEVLRTGTFLPNASGPGLSILPGTPRQPASAQDLAIYRALYAQTIADWGFTEEEIAAELAKVQESYASGWALTPGPTDPVERALNAVNEQIVGRESPSQQGAYTTAQISAINYLGGMTPENMQRILDEGGLDYLNKVAIAQGFMNQPGTPPAITPGLGIGTGAAIPAPVLTTPKLTPTPGVDYAAAVAKMQGYVDKLQAVPVSKRTPAQKAALETDLAQLAKVQALAAQQAKP